MSAFVIRHQEMDRCVSAIFHQRYGSYAVRTFCGKPLEEWDKNELGALLYGLNTRAVAERYREEPEDRSDYRVRPVACTLVEGIKALHCLIYQCYEGEVPETEAFKELERAANELCVCVVRDLPAYDRAA